MLTTKSHGSQLTNASDRQRLEAASVVDTATALRLIIMQPNPSVTVTQLIEKTDDSLFHNITQSSHHLRHPLIYVYRNSSNRTNITRPPPPRPALPGSITVGREVIDSSMGHVVASPWVARIPWGPCLLAWSYPPPPLRCPGITD